MHSSQLLISMKMCFSVRNFSNGTNGIFNNAKSRPYLHVMFCLCMFMALAEGAIVIDPKNRFFKCSLKIKILFHFIPLKLLS